MPDAASSSGPWLPDGHGLDPISVSLVAEHSARVHLRLTAAGRYPRVACGGGLGEFWTGLATEVTCRSCLEVVHA